MKNIKVSRKTPLKVLRSKSVKLRPKHISIKNAPEMLRQHSRKHPAPAKLGKLIDLINALPAHTLALEQMDEIARSEANVRIEDRRASGSLRDFIVSHDEIHMDSALPDVFAEIVNRLPDRLQEFIGPTLSPVADDARKASGYRLIPPDDVFLNAMNRYRFLLDARDALMDIAQWHSKKPNERRCLFPAPSSGVLMFYSDVNGKLAFQIEPLFHDTIATLVGVEVQRIRRCPICEKIYWAERIDQPTCSKRCNNVRRSRIQRGTYQERRERYVKKCRQYESDHFSPSPLKNCPIRAAVTLW